MTTVVLFAGARIATGTSRFDTEATTLDAVVEEVFARGGDEMRRLFEHCSVMVDRVVVSDLTTPLLSTSEVAILPPVSGG